MAFSCRKSSNRIPCNYENAPAVPVVSMVPERRRSRTSDKPEMSTYRIDPYILRIPESLLCKCHHRSYYGRSQPARASSCALNMSESVRDIRRCGRRSRLPSVYTPENTGRNDSPKTANRRKLVRCNGLPHVVRLQASNPVLCVCVNFWRFQSQVRELLPECCQEFRRVVVFL